MRKLIYILVLSCALCVGSDAWAQKKSPTGKKGAPTAVKRPLGVQHVQIQGGRKATLAKIDTLSADSIGVQADSLRRVDSLFKPDTLARGALQIKSDSALVAETLHGKRAAQRFSLTRDTISPGALVGLSFVPGLGQIYNRQWWKAPIIYAGIGAFTAGGLIFSNQARIAQNGWQNALNSGAPQLEIDGYKAKMMGHRTTSTVFFALAGATYLYQLADATFNYRGKTNHIRKATTLAALFPGAGFIYTRTYWRLPIYYGGFAVVGTVIDYNDRSYQRYKKAWELLTDNDPSTVDEFNGRHDERTLKNAMDAYRRDRDFGIICMAAIYLLSVVDTYVIATLKNWDISDNLAIGVEPKLFEERLGRNGAGTMPTGAGLALKIKF